MKQWVRNYILFAIMFLLGLFQAVSGFVLWLVLPHGQGYRGGRGLELVDNTFIWQRDTWIDLHDWTAVALLVMIIIHLILHWKWIVHMTKKSLRPGIQ
jgi:hypothetical protein